MKPEPHWVDRARAGRCPLGCECDLVAGPWGGASRNVFCPQCMSRWNFHGINHGIVGVDDEGYCKLEDIEYAKDTYPNDQPFRLPT